MCVPRTIGNPLINKLDTQEIALLEFVCSNRFRALQWLPSVYGLVSKLAPLALAPNNSSTVLPQALLAYSAAFSQTQSGVQSMIQHSWFAKAYRVLHLKTRAECTLEIDEGDLLSTLMLMVYVRFFNNTDTQRFGYLLNLFLSLLKKVSAAKRTSRASHIIFGICDTIVDISRAVANSNFIALAHTHAADRALGHCDLGTRREFLRDICGVEQSHTLKLVFLCVMKHLTTLRRCFRFLVEEQIGIEIQCEAGEIIAGLLSAVRQDLESEELANSIDWMLRLKWSDLPPDVEPCQFLATAFCYRLINLLQVLMSSESILNAPSSPAARGRALDMVMFIHCHQVAIHYPYGFSSYHDLVKDLFGRALWLAGLALTPTSSAIGKALFELANRVLDATTIQTLLIQEGGSYTAGLLAKYWTDSSYQRIYDMLVWGGSVYYSVPCQHYVCRYTPPFARCDEARNPCMW